MRNKRNMLDWLDPTRRTVEPRAGQRGVVRMIGEPSSANEQRRTMRFICSTRNVDRYGEIVEPEAFRKWLPTFMTNPVFLAGHVNIAPDGKPPTIGRWLELEITTDGLVGTAEFIDDRHLNEQLAEQYWLRYSKGFQRAVSVGFITHKWVMEQRALDEGPERVRVFKEVELVEVSAVAIPANRQSLVRAASLLEASADEAPGSGVGAEVLVDELLAVPGFAEAFVRRIEDRLCGDPGDLKRGLDLEGVGGLRGHAGFGPIDEYDFHDEESVSEASSDFEDDGATAEEVEGDDEEVKQFIRQWAESTAV